MFMLWASLQLCSAQNSSLDVHLSLSSPNPCLDWRARAMKGVGVLASHALPGPLPLPTSQGSLKKLSRAVEEKQDAKRREWDQKAPAQPHASWRNLPRLRAPASPTRTALAWDTYLCSPSLPPLVFSLPLLSRGKK